MDNVFRYSLSKDGQSYEVVAVNDNSLNEYVIPREVNGKPVTAIGKSVFNRIEYQRNEGAKQIEKISIPSSIKRIDGNALYCQAKNLIFEDIRQISFSKEFSCRYFDIESVSLTMSEEEFCDYVSDFLRLLSNGIDEYRGIRDVWRMLVECKKLILNGKEAKDLEIRFPEEVVGVQQIFQKCNWLGKVFLNKELSVISPYAFYNSSITEIEFENNSRILEIGKGAFANCKKLSKVNFADTTGWNKVVSETDYGGKIREPINDYVLKDAFSAVSVLLEEKELTRDYSEEVENRIISSDEKQKILHRVYQKAPRKWWDILLKHSPEKMVRSEMKRKILFNGLLGVNIAVLLFLLSMAGKIAEVLGFGTLFIFGCCSIAGFYNHKEKQRTVSAGDVVDYVSCRYGVAHISEYAKVSKAIKEKYRKTGIVIMCITIIPIIFILISLSRLGSIVLFVACIIAIIMALISYTLISGPTDYKNIKMLKEHTCPVCGMVNTIFSDGEVGGSVSDYKYKTYSTKSRSYSYTVGKVYNNNKEIGKVIGTGYDSGYDYYKVGKRQDVTTYRVCLNCGHRLYKKETRDLGSHTEYELNGR